MTALPPRRLLFAEAASLLQGLGGRLISVAQRRPPVRDAQPVMVLPGFLSGDWATGRLRDALVHAGYAAYPWRLGWNMGASADLLDHLDARIDIIIAETGRTPALVGWSLGGVFAREYAKFHPEKVARVISLGSPFSGSPRANHAWRLYHLVAGHAVEHPPLNRHPAARPAVPTFALWSARDGIVATDSARGTAEESDHQIQVDCTHIGFVAAPAAITAILFALGADISESGDTAPRV